MEVVQFYTIKYHKAVEALNCLPPSIEPRATDILLNKLRWLKPFLTTAMLMRSMARFI